MQDDGDFLTMDRMNHRVSTRQPWLRHLLCIGLAVILAALLVACKADPLERRLERTEALVELLETHRDDPDALLNELESFSDAHAGEWRAESAEIESMDEAERIRLISVYEQRMKETYIDLYDASLYIQDHLGREDPAKLARFLELMDSLADP